MIKQLAHLCLKTSQLARMTEFYRDALGATAKFRYLNRAGEPVGCYFAFGGTTFVEIFDHTDAHRRSNSSKPLEPLEEPRDPWLMRYNHFCLQVEGLDAYVAQLESRGVTVTGQAIGRVFVSPPRRAPVGPWACPSLSPTSAPPRAGSPAVSTNHPAPTRSR